MGIVPVHLAAAALRWHRADAERPSVDRHRPGVFRVGPRAPSEGVRHEHRDDSSAAMLRYIPIVNNARMPGRAMVVVMLGLATLASVFVARWRPSAIGRRSALAALAIFLIVESAPAPFPVDQACGAADLSDAARQAGSRRGLRVAAGGSGRIGGRGRLNEMQSSTIRPFTDGRSSAAISRGCPASVVALYAERSLAERSAGSVRARDRGAETDGPLTLPDPSIAAERLRANGIAFVVLDRAAAPARLTAYVETALPARAGGHRRRAVALRGGTGIARPVNL